MYVPNKGIFSTAYIKPNSKHPLPVSLLSPFRVSQILTNVFALHLRPKVSSPLAAGACNSLTKLTSKVNSTPDQQSPSEGQEKENTPSSSPTKKCATSSSLPLKPASRGNEEVADETSSTTRCDRQSRLPNQPLDSNEKDENHKLKPSPNATSTGSDVKAGEVHRQPTSPPSQEEKQKQSKAGFPI